jgi:mannose-6-phosphate isomerase-like protein (cupin superfamily)
MRSNPLVSMLIAACMAVIPVAMTSAQEPALTKAPTDAGLQWSPCPPGLPEGCTLAVLHGDPARPNADIFLKLPAKSTIAEHSHTSAERMVLISGELQVTYKGQPQATLKPGAYAYGPARINHSGTCVSAAPCVLFIAFEQPVDLIPAK